MRGFLPGIIVGVVLWVICAMVSPAKAEAVDVFRSGPWYGFAFYSDTDGAFTYCGIDRRHGTSVLLIGIAANGNLRIIISDEAWNLGANVAYTLAVQVDQRATRTISATGNGTTILFDMGADWEFLEDLRSGYTLYISAGQVVPFSLEGTYVALQKAMQCTLARTRTAEQTNPFSQGGKGQLLTGEIGTVLTADQAANLKIMLLSAGFENVQIAAGSQVRDELGEGILASWTAWDGVTGLLMGEPFDGSTTPRRFATAALANLGAECDGQLAMAHEDVSHHDESTFIRAGAACATAAGTYYYDALFNFGGGAVFVMINVSTETTRAQVSAATEQLLANLQQ